MFDVHQFLLRSDWTLAASGRTPSTSVQFSCNPSTVVTLGKYFNDFDNEGES
jgi:hypothetical protein